MTTTDALFAINQPIFMGKVRYWLLTACVNVRAEPSTVTNHTQRDALAKTILTADEPTQLAWVTRFARMALTNTTLFAYSNPDLISDSDMQFTINSLFNTAAV